MFLFFKTHNLGLTWWPRQHSSPHDCFGCPVSSVTTAADPNLCLPIKDGISTHMGLPPRWRKRLEDQGNGTGRQAAVKEQRGRNPKPSSIPESHETARQRPPPPATRTSTTQAEATCCYPLNHQRGSLRHRRKNKQPVEWLDEELKPPLSSLWQLTAPIPPPPPSYWGR